MLTDTRILHRHGNHEVLAECQAVLFPDNKIVQLHDVRRRGLDDLYLRAMQYEESHWCVFDLRTIESKFAGEIPRTLHRDRAGLVLYTLRAKFPTCAEFQAGCMNNFEAAWIAPDGDPMRAYAAFPRSAITFQPELRAGA